MSFFFKHSGNYSTLCMQLHNTKHIISRKMEKLIMCHFILNRPIFSRHQWNNIYQLCQNI